MREQTKLFDDEIRSRSFRLDLVDLLNGHLNNEDDDDDDLFRLDDFDFSIRLK